MSVMKPPIAEAEAIAAEARPEFGRLTSAQLNWKPGADRWSVAQCFDHLVRIDSLYWPTFRAIEDGSYRTPLLRRIPLLPRLWGALIHGAVKPDAARRYPTTKRALPAASDLPADIIDRFVGHQREVVEHMRRLGEKDAGLTVIGSPVGPLASYDVDTALRIMVSHARRHMLQARRVMESPGFPSQAA